MKHFIIHLFIFALAASAHAQGISVIVNITNTSAWQADEIKPYIRDLFMNKKEKFPNGNTAKPVDQPDDRPIRQHFYKVVAGKDETAMNVYWSNLIFTGSGKPPKILSDDSAVKRFVSETQNGIGYISSDMVDGSVKAIYTFE